MSDFNCNKKRTRQDKEYSISELEDQHQQYIDFQPKEGQNWYLVSISWFYRWRQFCIHLRNNTQEVRTEEMEFYPGPITNDHLFHCGELLPDLKLNENCMAVPEPIWDMLVECYGFNGQPIKRKLISKKYKFGIEIYPPIIAVYLVDVSGELDQKLPPVVLTVSKKTLLSEVLRVVSGRFHIPKSKELRLWDSREYIKSKLASIDPRYLLTASIIDTSDPRACVDRSGACIWIAELYGNDDKFTFDIVEQSVRGKCGLTNLGNTCYMNSSLQCLSNTPQLTKWFLSGKYKEEINRDNPLGMNGQVAEAYGRLIEKMWTSDKSYLSPVAFKNTICKFNATFKGIQQHDTQELLAFLLDGLHEDLNCAKKKSPIKLPEVYDDLKDEEIAQRCWAYHQERNDSIIVDLFHGQFKSKIICKACQNASATFDPFMYISLPLPVQNDTTTQTIHYIPYDRSHRRTRILLEIPRNADIAYLKKKVADLMDTDPEYLLVVEIYRQKLYKVFEPYEETSSIDPKDFIFVYELPCLVTPYIKKNEDASSISLINKDEDSSSEFVIFPVYCFFIDSNDSSPQPFGYPIILAMSHEYAADINKIYFSICDHIQRFATMSFFEYSTPELLSTESDRLSQQDPICTTATATAERRATGQPIADLFKIKVFESDFPSQHSHFLPTCSRFYPFNTTDLSNRVETNKEVNNKLTGETNDIQDRNPKQITIDLNSNYEDQSFFSDITNNNEWLYAKRATITSEKSNRPRALIQQKEGIILEWTAMKVDQFFDSSPDNLDTNTYFGTWNEWVDINDPDIKDDEVLNGKKHIALSDCFDEFTREEDMSEEEALWYCPKCKKRQSFTKKMDIWKLPSILVIQLKRFSHSCIWGGKITDYIDFPITNLDMTDRVLSIKGSEKKRLVYDLYAVNNHYGDLEGGHYTTFAQNDDDKEWYLFNDSRVIDIKVSDIKSEAAYLLFYKRDIKET